MPVPVLICDDSTFAQKQITRALPSDWDVEVSFAKNGELGLEALLRGKGEIMFLDLTMPIMDGFEVLKTVAEQEIKSNIIVISGDIQPESHKRVMDAGALAFIKKPVDKQELLQVLNTYQLYNKNTCIPATSHSFTIDVKDKYREVANIASGRAVDLLARLFDAFIHMPIPNVNVIEVSELSMTLSSLDRGEPISAVCQGFIGGGIAGEGLLIFSESSFTDIADLMEFRGEINNSVRCELLMDIACILSGACLKGIAEQLDIGISQSHPVVLGQHLKIDEFIERSSKRWKKSLAIEMGFSIENRNINCDLLLLFTEDSLDRLSELASYL